MVDIFDKVIIQKKCGQFIAESKGIPLLKNLPSSYPDIKKVKVRHKTNIPVLGTLLNKAFDHKIYERAVFANGPQSFKPILNENVIDFDIFYVFPPDGFHFLYNTTYSELAIEKLQQIENTLGPIGPDLIRFNFLNDNLSEAIDSNAQIILYDIPYYYCVRASSVDYTDIIS